MRVKPLRLWTEDDFAVYGPIVEKFLQSAEGEVFLRMVEDMGDRIGREALRDTERSIEWYRGASDILDQLIASYRIVANNGAVASEEGSIVPIPAAPQVRLGPAGA